MASSQLDLFIAEAPNSPKRRRRYKRKQSFNHVRDVITAAVNSGKKSKQILAYLADIGVPMTLNQLNRQKEEWDLNGKHLRLKHKIHIRNVEARAQKKGKVVRNWWIIKNKRIRASRTRVSHAQLEAIRSMDMVELENVTPSPGMLQPSPLDIVTSESPGVTCEEPSLFSDILIDDAEVPNGGINETDRELIESNLDIDDSDHTLTEDDPLENDTNVPNSTAPTPQRAERPPRKNSRHISMRLLGNTHGDIMEEVSDQSSRPEDDIHERAKLLQGITDGIKRLIDDEGGRQLEEREDPADDLTAESIADDLSLKFRHKLNEWMKSRNKDMGDFVERVDELRLTQGLNSRDSVTVGWLESGYVVTYRLPYEASKCIHNGRWTEFVADKGGVELSEKWVLTTFYSWFGELWHACGSDTATFRQRDGKPITAIMAEVWQGDFQKRVMHIPYLVRTFGVSYWATLYALRQLAYFRFIYTDEASHEGAALCLQPLRTFGLFGASPFIGRIVHELLDPTAAGCLLTTTTRCKLAACWFFKSRAQLGDAHPETIKAAANFMSVLHETPGTHSVHPRNLSSFIVSQLKAMSQNCAPTTYNRYLIIDVLLSHLKSKLPQPVTEIAKIFGPILYGEHDHTSAFSHSYVSYEYRVAKAYSDQANYIPSIRSLYNAIHRFPEDFPRAWYSSAVRDLAVEVMTARGMVRYAQPHIATLCAAYEESDSYGDNHKPYYDLVAAEAAASFESYIDLNEYQWCLPEVLEVMEPN